QPLVSNGTLLVATEADDIYGLDPVTGAQRWSRHLHVPWNPADVNCGDLVPTVGVTGTPVVDPSTDTEYFLAKTYASGTSGPGAGRRAAASSPTVRARCCSPPATATILPTAGWPDRTRPTRRTSVSR